jgi:hypothetical protein
MACLYLHFFPLQASPEGLRLSHAVQALFAQCKVDAKWWDTVAQEQAKVVSEPYVGSDQENDEEAAVAPGEVTLQLTTEEEKALLYKRTTEGKRSYLCLKKDPPPTHPAATAGLRVGAELLAVNGEELPSNATVEFISSLHTQLAEARQDIASQAMARGFRHEWVRLPWTFKASLPPTSPSNNPNSNTDLSASLQGQVKRVWKHFTAGMGSPRGPISTKELRETVLTLHSFERLLAFVHDKSFQLGDGVVPSPLALYCNSLTSDSVGEAEREDAMGVLVSVMEFLRSDKPPNSPEGEAESEGLTVTAVADMASKHFPAFSGRVLYPTILTLPKARHGWQANCEVLFVGPGLEATLVATRDLEPGEGLMFGEEDGNELDQSGSAEESAEEDEEHDDEGADDEERVLPPPKKRLKS